MLSKEKCDHDWEIFLKSNVLQLHHKGIFLRLCIVKCKKCGEMDQHWVSAGTDCSRELRIGKSVLCEWTKMQGE